MNEDERKELYKIGEKMGLWDTLMETFSNSPEWKGKRFEQFIIDKFDPKYFAVSAQTHSWKTNSDRYVESSLDPDFTFRYRRTGDQFAIECKYRSNLYNGKLDCCSDKQLERYREYASKNNIPVFIVVGLGGYDDHPNDLFVIPLAEMKYPSLFPSVFNKYHKNQNSNFYWKNGKLT